MAVWEKDEDDNKIEQFEKQNQKWSFSNFVYHKIISGNKSWGNGKLRVHPE